MKKKITLIVFIVLAICSLNVKAQEVEEKASPFTVGADIYSNYIWRGTKFGTGPAFQPTVKFSKSGLTIGVWGSFDAAGYTEVDPYISYTLPFGLSIGMTDYYYPSLGGAFSADSSNAYELNLGYTTGGLSLSANYILNEAALPASSGKDMYFQAAYAFTNFNITVGAGDGWHTSDTEFNVCLVGIGTGKVIKLSDTFSIPVTGQVIYNPDRNLLHVVAGISF
jgi:hypothetical protein